MQNQRNQERISTQRPAKMKVAEQVFDGIMINLSLSGIGLLTQFDLNKGVTVQVMFSLPGYEQASQLTLTGTVVHRTQLNQQCLFGIEFASLSLHQQLIITGYIHFHHRLD